MFFFSGGIVAPEFPAALTKHYSSTCRN